MKPEEAGQSVPDMCRHVGIPEPTMISRHRYA
jgi:hypothetical protein